VEFVGTAIDVTEQAQARIELEKAFEEIKQRTEALRRSEGYLAEAQKLPHTGIVHRSLWEANTKLMRPPVREVDKSVEKSSTQPQLASPIQKNGSKVMAS